MIYNEEQAIKLEEKVSTLTKENFELKVRVKTLEKYEILVNTIKEMINSAQTDANLATLKGQYFSVLEDVEKEIKELRAKRKQEEVDNND